MRPVSYACSVQPGEALDDEVIVHLGNPGLKRSAEAARQIALRVLFARLLLYSSLCE
jgi:hypothetical protein